MPTENRSSNTEMVSVPLEPTREMLAAALEAEGIIPRWRAMVAAAPTQQHQGDPVALPARKITNVLSYHASLGAEGWNACLDEIAKLGPLYTHPAPADPGEAERLRENHRNHAARLIDERGQLRAEVERLRTELGEVKGEYDRSANKVAALRAQLAERDALLRKIEGYHWANVDPEERARTRAELRDMLSASAEPSAPLFTPETPCVWPDSCGHCSKEPSAPVEHDERAAFEACIRREWPMAPISRKRDLLPKDDPCFGDYCDEPLQRAWVGWQMRAALERKPS